MSKKQQDVWNKRFNELYEKYCEQGEHGQEAADHADRVAAREIYQEELT